MEIATTLFAILTSAIAVEGSLIHLRVHFPTALFGGGPKCAVMFTADPFEVNRAPGMDGTEFDEYSFSLYPAKEPDVLPFRGVRILDWQHSYKWVDGSMDLGIRPAAMTDSPAMFAGRSALTVNARRSVEFLEHDRSRVCFVRADGNVPRDNYLNQC